MPCLATLVSYTATCSGSSPSTTATAYNIRLAFPLEQPCQSGFRESSPQRHGAAGQTRRTDPNTCAGVYREPANHKMSDEVPG